MTVQEILAEHRRLKELTLTYKIEAQLYYSRWQRVPGDSEASKKYHEAWQRYTEANTQLFLFECEHGL